MAWDFSDDRPIYLQLMEQLKLGIVSGTYPPGSRLPSVRELAADASVNPNTMQKALSELEREGLVYAQRTSGRFVTEDQGRITAMKEELARELIRSFLENMEQLGYTSSQAQELIAKSRKEDASHES